MSDIYPMNPEISIDLKWAAVKQHYETAYKIKFKERLSDNDINLCWMKMNALRMNLSRHFEAKPGLVDKYFKDK